MTPAQASGHFPAAQAHGHKYFDPDAFFQSKMAMGHGGLLLAEWLLVLPTLPESRPVLCTFSHPDRAVHFGSEHLPDLSIQGNIHIPFADSEQRQPVELLKKWLYDKMLDTCGHLHRA